ncbi:MAG: hypothetical protein KDK70_14895 [Myxococcales bacterium]|nr:hypothetical protein [Myxococcales bacterium]
MAFAIERGTIYAHRVRGWVFAVSLGAWGCTTPNPLYDDDGGSGASPTGESSTRGPTDDGVDDRVDDGTAEGGSTSLPATSTSAGEASSTTVAITTADSSNDTTGCMPVSMTLEPAHDTFVATGESCGGWPCDTVSWGSSSEGSVRDYDPIIRRYMLLTFELPAIQEFGPEEGSLELRVYDPMVPFQLRVTPVRPGPWEEGSPDGSPPMGVPASTWNHANTVGMVPWVPPEPKGAGDFADLLELGTPLPVEVYDLGGDPIVQLFYGIPIQVLQDGLEADQTVSLAVTLVGGPEELIIRALESDSHIPRLHFDGC